MTTLRTRIHASVDDAYAAWEHGGLPSPSSNDLVWLAFRADGVEADPMLVDVIGGQLFEFMCTGAEFEDVIDWLVGAVA